jgi:uncharacterized protein YndB with AHSA1/START domain
MAIEEQAVRREQILPVDRETAWVALRDAEGLETWLADEVDLEVREGAEGRLRWRDGEERMALVEEVRERRRVSLRWCEAGGEPSIVELTLDDVPGGTRLVVVELPVLAIRLAGAAFEECRNAAWGPQMVAGVA